MQLTPEQIERARIIVNQVAVSTDKVITYVAELIAENDRLTTRVLELFEQTPQGQHSRAEAMRIQNQ